MKVFGILRQNGIGVKNINVMSQYNAQCTELKRTLAEEHVNDANVNTVVGSQGDCILLRF